MNTMFYQIRQILSGKLPVTDRLKYSMILYSVCAVHGILMLFFIIAGMPLMVRYNFLSVLLYLYCCRLILSEAYQLIYYTVCIEVYINTLVSTWLIGWESGLGMFLIILLPASLYITHAFPVKKIHISLFFGLASCIIFILCYTISQVHAPVYTFSSPLFMHLLYIFNTLCTFGLLTVFSMLFIYDVRTAQQALQQENETLGHIAMFDALTGLYNRWSMQEFLETTLKKDIPFCLAMCDIDNFKHINDTYGHECGDVVLKDIAGIIRQKTSPGSYVCRWGGEEFLILLNHYSPKDAFPLADSIRKAVANTNTVFQEYTVSHTITIGVASHIRSQSLEDTITAADTLLYAGKNQGKNVVITEPY